MQRLGSALAIAIATAVFAAHGRIGSAASFAAGFRPALTIGAALSLLGAMTALGAHSRSASLAQAQPLSEAA